MPSANQVTLVNHEDQKLGTMDKIKAHRLGKLHRAVSVFIFNQQGQLLVQQRSEHKIVAPLQWANTVCGNVAPGESYEQCAQRRLAEEIGFKLAWLHQVTTHNKTCKEKHSKSGAQKQAILQSNNDGLQSLGKFQYRVEFDNGFIESEIDTVFAGVFKSLNPDFELKAEANLFANLSLDLREVRQVRWLDFALVQSQAQLQAQAQSQTQVQGPIYNWAPWLVKIFQQQQIESKLQQMAGARHL